VNQIIREEERLPFPAAQVERGTFQGVMHPRALTRDVRVTVQEHALPRREIGHGSAGLKQHGRRGNGGGGRHRRRGVQRGGAAPRVNVNVCEISSFIDIF
jgi:hypothetical protein